MREVAWVVFDEIHYMRDKGLFLYEYLYIFIIHVCSKIIVITMIVTYEIKTKKVKEKQI